MNLWLRSCRPNPKQAGYFSSLPRLSRAEVLGQVTIKELNKLVITTRHTEEVITELILKNCTCREFAFFLFKNSKVDVRIGTKICCRKSVLVCQSNNERDKKNLLITSGALITLIADLITVLFSCGHIALECNKSQQFSHATKMIVCLVVLQFYWVPLSIEPIISYHDLLTVSINGFHFFMFFFPVTEYLKTTPFLNYLQRNVSSNF